MPLTSKPSEEAIQGLIAKLEEFLSAHQAKITIELWDSPMVIKSWKKNEIEKKEHSWIKDVKVNVPGIGEIDTHIDEELPDIWLYAWGIQNDIYRALPTDQIMSKEWQDRFWKLWDHLEKT